MIQPKRPKSRKPLFQRFYESAVDTTDSSKSFADFNTFSDKVREVESYGNDTKVSETGYIGPLQYAPRKEDGSGSVGTAIQRIKNIAKSRGMDKNLLNEVLEQVEGVATKDMSYDQQKFLMLADLIERPEAPFRSWMTGDTEDSELYYKGHHTDALNSISSREKVLSNWDNGVTRYNEKNPSTINISNRKEGYFPIESQGEYNPVEGRTKEDYFNMYDNSFKSPSEIMYGIKISDTNQKNNEDMKNKKKKYPYGGPIKPKKFNDGTLATSIGEVSNKSNQNLDLSVSDSLLSKSQLSEIDSYNDPTKKLGFQYAKSLDGYKGMQRSIATTNANLPMEGSLNLGKYGVDQMVDGAKVRGSNYLGLGPDGNIIEGAGYSDLDSQARRQRTSYLQELNPGRDISLPGSKQYPHGGSFGDNGFSGVNINNFNSFAEGDTSSQMFGNMLGSGSAATDSASYLNMFDTNAIYNVGSNMMSGTQGINADGAGNGGGLGKAGWSAIAGSMGSNLGNIIPEQGKFRFADNSKVTNISDFKFDSRFSNERGKQYDEDMNKQKGVMDAVGNIPIIGGFFNAGKGIAKAAVGATGGKSSYVGNAMENVLNPLGHAMDNFSQGNVGKGIASLFGLGWIGGPEKYKGDRMKDYLSVARGEYINESRDTLSQAYSNVAEHGGEFSEGTPENTYKIEIGGEHKDNPNGGVAFNNIDTSNPDLGEEGEVIYIPKGKSFKKGGESKSKYVFSNKLYMS